MTDQTTVRWAGPDDFDGLVALAQQFHDHEHLPWGPAEESALRHLLREPNLGRVLVGVQGTRCIGYVVLVFGYSIEFHGVDGFIDELYLAPSHRGTGFGSRLLQAAEDEARRAGVAALHLEVDHDNAAASRLYERLGYRGHARHLMTKWLGDPKA